MSTEMEPEMDAKELAVWVALFHKGASLIEELHEKLEVERRKVRFLMGQNRRLLDESAVGKDDLK